MTGADALVDRLKAAGTAALFGLPGGGGNLDLIEAARLAGLPFVTTATESGSAIAAIAQAELTRTPGACVTTLGPGVASVVNGVACAHLDRAPILVVTDGTSAASRAFEHQRLDHGALLRPITKWSGVLEDGDAGRALADAFSALGTRPPGPVHLDCAPGSLETTFATPASVEPAAERAARAGRDASGVIARLGRARRPIVIAGLAARRPEDAAALRAFCETLGVPALVTYKAKGVIPDDHAWFGGVFTHGAIERQIMDEADLVVGVGFDPVEILPRRWSYGQPVVSLAPWQMSSAHVPFEAHCTGAIAESLAEVASSVTTTWDAARVQSAARAARAALDLPSSGLAPARVVQVAASVSPATRLTVDAGAHMFAATVIWPATQPGDVLISNGLSTMGFAVPAAVGAAAIGRHRLEGPPRRVLALTGDGGLLVCLGELATLARERLPVTVIVLNDGALSLIKIKQAARGFPAAGVALGAIDWQRIAGGFGLAHWSARTEPELRRALEAAAATEGPALLDVTIDPSTYGDLMKVIRG